jgi:hypothetical protein
MYLSCVQNQLLRSSPVHSRAGNDTAGRGMNTAGRGITGSLDGDVQSVFTWLVSVVKIAVVLREFSFVFCRKVVDR